MKMKGLVCFRFCGVFSDVTTFSTCVWFQRFTKVLKVPNKLSLNNEFKLRSWAASQNQISDFKKLFLISFELILRAVCVT